MDLVAWRTHWWFLYLSPFVSMAISFSFYQFGHRRTTQLLLCWLLSCKSTVDDGCPSLFPFSWCWTCEQFGVCFSSFWNTERKEWEQSTSFLPSSFSLWRDWHCSSSNIFPLSSRRRLDSGHLSVGSRWDHHSPPTTATSQRVLFSDLVLYRGWGPTWSGPTLLSRRFFSICL